MKIVKIDSVKDWMLDEVDSALDISVVDELAMASVVMECYNRGVREFGCNEGCYYSLSAFLQDCCMFVGAGLEGVDDLVIAIDGTSYSFHRCYRVKKGQLMLTVGVLGDDGVEVEDSREYFLVEGI